MIDYAIIKANHGKIVEIKNGSADCWKAGEIITALGYKKDKSNFIAKVYGVDTYLVSGYVTLDNDTIIKVI